MGVGKLGYMKSLLFLCIIVLDSSCRANVDIASKIVLDHVSKTILQATADYGRRIEQCDQMTAANAVPMFDRKVLKSVNVTTENIITAIAFLQFRNYFMCEREERLKLAFHLGTMESLKRELGVDVKSIENLQSVISYPSKKEITLEVKYLELTESQRSYFESVVGNAPFDLMKTLKENKLLRE